jgi:hypothetical protein
VKKQNIFERQGKYSSLLHGTEKGYYLLELINIRERSKMILGALRKLQIPRGKNMEEIIIAALLVSYWFTG